MPVALVWCDDIRAAGLCFHSYNHIGMEAKYLVTLGLMILTGTSLIAQAGHVGINISNPQSTFHVRRSTGSGGPYLNNALATFESSDQSYLHLSHPAAQESGLLSGTDATLIRSGLVFGIDSSMMFRSGGNTTRMKLNPSGYLGINTTSPKSYLHIRRAAPVNGPVHPLSFAIFESSNNGYIQFSNTAATESGLLAGSDITSIRSALIFAADSALILRSGGNIDRIHIRPSGDVGINTSAPKSQLHVRESAVPGAIIDPNTTMLIEKNGPSFLQFVSNNTSPSGIYASDQSTTIRSSIEFLPDFSMSLIAGGDLGIHIDGNGDVGVGHDNPQAQLDVSGTFKLGGSGTVMSGVYQFSAQHDIPNVPAGGSYLASFSYGPASTGATAYISPGFDLPDGLIIAYVRCANDEVRVKFTNISPAAINPPQYVYHITVMK